MKNDSDQPSSIRAAWSRPSAWRNRARVSKLDGLRLAVLDNTKWNANRLLRKTVAKLEQNHSFATVNYYCRESFSKEADPALLTTIAAANDIVLTAIGD